jgi:hypothetical protein
LSSFDDTLVASFASDPVSHCIHGLLPTSSRFGDLPAMRL